VPVCLGRTRHVTLATEYSFYSSCSPALWATRGSGLGSWALLCSGSVKWHGRTHAPGNHMIVKHPTEQSFPLREREPFSLACPFRARAKPERRSRESQLLLSHARRSEPAAPARSSAPVPPRRPPGARQRYRRRPGPRPPAAPSSIV
jgi:hypothetical protein